MYNFRIKQGMFKMSTNLARTYNSLIKGIY